MIRATFLILLVFYFCRSENTHAQSFYTFKKKQSLLLTAGAGTSTYYGDLANPNDYLAFQPSLGAGLQYFFTPRIAARAELNFFTLKASDQDATNEGRKSRNLSFQSSNFEINVVGIVNLFSDDSYYRRSPFNAYGFVGVGLLYFNPKAKNQQGSLVALQPLHTEGKSYSLLTPVVPFGIGFKVKVNPQLNIALESGFRMTFTDYLDDVSSVYPDKVVFNNNADALYLYDRRTDSSYGIVGSKRGESQNNDNYMILNVKIEYYLPQSSSTNGKKRYLKKQRF